MSGASRRYVFAPLERRGLLLGLAPSQLAALAGGALAALVVLHAHPHPSGVVAALAVALAGAAGACLSVEGRPPVAWLPVLLGWVRRRRRGPVVDRSLLGGQAVQVRSRLREVTGAGPVPRGAPNGTPQRADVGRSGRGGGPGGVGRRDVLGSGIEVLGVDGAAGEPPLGVIHDRWYGTWAAVLPVRGRAFALLDPADKERRLGAWGSVLASMARTGSPVHRVQWVERSLPGDAAALGAHLERAAARPLADPEHPGRASAYAGYAQLLASSGPATVDHETLVVVAVHPRRAARALRAFGRGQDAVLGLLGREVRLLQGQLRNAELVAGEPLDPAGTILALRAAVDSAARHRPGPPGGRAPHPGGWLGRGGAWPLATDEAWSCLRADATWYATFWVAEWPRVEVTGDFLAPLLLSGTGRSVSVTMAPVPPERARRQVEAARTADAADDELRRRAGFLATARRRRESEGVLQREVELADGHAELRFSGYLTVSGSDRAALEAACAEVEQLAGQCRLELRRLYGQQQEAFTWTLPIGRGLA